MLQAQVLRFWSLIVGVNLNVAPLLSMQGFLCVRCVQNVPEIPLRQICSKCTRTISYCDRFVGITMVRAWKTWGRDEIKHVVLQIIASPCNFFQIYRNENKEDTSTIFLLLKWPSMSPFPLPLLRAQTGNALRKVPWMRPFCAWNPHDFHQRITLQGCYPVWRLRVKLSLFVCELQLFVLECGNGQQFHIHSIVYGLWMS